MFTCFILQFFFSYFALTNYDCSVKPILVFRVVVVHHTNLVYVLLLVVQCVVNQLLQVVNEFLSAQY